MKLFVKWKPLWWRCAKVPSFAFALGIVFALTFPNYVFAEAAREIDGDTLRARMALVIGNSKYSSNPLANPTNDAEDIAASLRTIGFSVTLATELDNELMRRVINIFIANLPDTAAALVFFAGHGVQHDGQNFLLPIDAVDKIKAPEDLDRNSLSLTRLLTELTKRKGGLSIVILDACRDFPFAQSMKIDGGLARSMASVRTKSNSHAKLQKRQDSVGLEGALIAFSTSPNATAADGRGRNSPYSLYLKDALRHPEASLEAILKLTRGGVTSATNGYQTPWYESSINGDFYPAGRGRIDFEELLKLLIPPLAVEKAAKTDVATPFWDVGAKEFSPIKWRYDHTVGAEGLKLQGFDDHEFGFKREGEVIITLNGKPTHYDLQKRLEPVRWEVILLGSRSGVKLISLGNSVLSHEFMGFGGLPSLHEDSDCTNGNESFGSKVYRVSLPDRIPAWLAENVSCGSGGCGRDYDLFFDPSYRSRFDCHR